MLKLSSKVQHKLAQLPSECHYRVQLAHHARRLPALRPVDRQIVKTCQRQGACVTSIEMLDVPETAAMLAAARAQLEEMRRLLPIAQIRKQIADSGQSAYPQIFTVTDLEAVANWGNSAHLLAIAENYIGLPVRFQGVHLRRDFANPEPITTQLWHQDLEDRRICKAIVYLDAVDDATGPFEFVPKPKISPLRAWRIHQCIKRSHRLGIDDAAMAMLVPRSRWKACPGAASTVIFADTKAVFHHGRSRLHERAALFFVYTAQQPLRPKHCTQYHDDTFDRPKPRSKVSQRKT